MCRLREMVTLLVLSTLHQSKFLGSLATSSTPCGRRYKAPRSGRSCASSRSRRCSCAPAAS
ncbi:hypothetical protein PR003_g14451 [Phytophthora rubi]|uniref:RxLR effector protein n=1 Tax=Phytophthora rubi TaxID=129364 RepID=A0A6A3KWE3_9STRA|nr:hypothetical protein PR001_g17741 [Phytophthora rubi]KAE9009927.1 hypothetical protein PR002_g15497 [Phytophthora rubi]KAE9332552.1 hypothetical protein PR003_g14451 [Phytophthora rubi]